MHILSDVYFICSQVWNKNFNQNYNSPTSPSTFVEQCCTDRNWQNKKVVSPFAPCSYCMLSRPSPRPLDNGVSSVYKSIYNVFLPKSRTKYGTIQTDELYTPKLILGVVVRVLDSIFRGHRFKPQAAELLRIAGNGRLTARPKSSLSHTMHCVK